MFGSLNEKVTSHLVYNFPRVTWLKIFEPNDQNFRKNFLSDIMGVRHQAKAKSVIILGTQDTHPWSATKDTSHYPNSNKQN